MKRKDFILIGLVLIVIVVSFGVNFIINNKDSDYIEIYVDNKLYKTYSIYDEDEFRINTKDGYNIVKIHDHGVEITEASCTDKVCVKSGFITKSSESIVCLPNKVNIKIKTHNKDKQESEEDIIAN
ncbi:NusG domain II-containing protein [Terrisporobacter mayombei]|nr:NusG domain II-containing protein [Terrisporobacter mayombei]